MTGNLIQESRGGRERREQRGAVLWLGVCVLAMECLCFLGSGDNQAEGIVLGGSFIAGCVS